MEIVYQTRFSYRGLSGWRSPAAGDPVLLYDAERLAHRFALFERITLPSLLAQEDAAFRHVVLAGSGMPRPWRLRLRALCLDTLGAARATVIFAPPGRAARPFNQASGSSRIASSAYQKWPTWSSRFRGAAHRSSRAVLPI